MYKSDGVNSFVHRADETVPTILLGDLNSVPTGKVYALFGKHGLVDLTKDIPITFHGFGTKKTGYQLDYILTDPITAARVSGVRIWDHCLNGIYLSDHYPIELICDL